MMNQVEIEVWCKCRECRNSFLKKIHSSIFTERNPFSVAQLHCQRCIEDFLKEFPDVRVLLEKAIEAMIETCSKRDEGDPLSPPSPPL